MGWGVLRSQVDLDYIINRTSQFTLLFLSWNRQNWLVLKTQNSKNLVLPFLFFLKTRFLAVTKYYRIEHYGGVWCTFQNCSIRTKPRISCTRTIFFQKFKIKKQKKNSSKWRRTRADIKSKISKFASYFQLGFTEGLDFFCFCWTKFLKIEKIQIMLEQTCLSIKLVIFLFRFSEKIVLFENLLFRKK